MAKKKGPATATAEARKKVPYVLREDFLTSWWEINPRSYTVYHETSHGVGSDMISGLSHLAHGGGPGSRPLKKIWDSIYRHMGMH